MKRKCLTCGKITTVEKVLPHIYKCKEGNHYFIEKEGLGLVIGNEDIPSISVVTEAAAGIIDDLGNDDFPSILVLSEAQAGLMATKTKEPINFINFKGVHLTNKIIGNKIMELPSLSDSQKLNVLNKLKGYGFDT